MDLFVAGHLHNFERTWPVFKGNVTATSYADPAAPVHVVVGMAGDNEGLLNRWMNATPAWRAHKDSQLGYARLHFQDKSTMKFDYVLSDSGAIVDSFTITKTEVAMV